MRCAVSKVKLYVAAALAGLAAVNGVLHLVPAPIVNEVLGLAGALGLYALPSPVLSHPKE